MMDDFVVLYLVLGFIGAALACGCVVVCRWLPSRFRRIAGLGVFAIGSLKAVDLCGGSEVWPEAWFTFALTISGGGLGLFLVFRSVEGTSGPRSALWAGWATFVVLGGALAVSYRDTNRGLPWPSELGTIRYLREPEGYRRDWLYWTWSQGPADSWERFEAAPEGWIRLETDYDSYSSFCIHPFTDDAARRYVEGLISRRWQELTKHSLLPPPKPDLRGRTVFGIYQHCYAVPHPSSGQVWPDPKSAVGKIALLGPVVFGYLPPRSVAPWAETEARRALAVDLEKALGAAAECLAPKGVRFRFLEADVAELPFHNEVSTLDLSASGGSGVYLVAPGKPPERISCSESTAYQAAVPALAPAYFGFPECVPDELRGPGVPEGCESRMSWERDQ